VSGIKNLRKIQLGSEGTAGTAAAGTTVWRGEGSIDDAIELKIPKEDVGLLAPTERAYIAALGASVKLSDTPATFEQLPYLLNMGVHAATGVHDGTGTGYIYTYTWPIDSTIAALQTYTLRGGDNQRADIMEYAFASELGIKGAAKDALMVNGTLTGRQATDGEFTGAVAIPTVEEIIWSMGKLYIDAVGGTIGSTQKTATWLGIDLKIKTGWGARWSGDGSLYFNHLAQTGPDISGTLTLEHDATGEAEIAAARAKTPRLVRMIWESPTAFAAPGTVYTHKTFTLDMVLQYTKVPPLSEKDGNDTLALPFRAVYSSTAALYAKAVVVNALTALP
jgi:hypothetical protein